MKHVPLKESYLWKFSNASNNPLDLYLNVLNKSLFASDSEQRASAHELRIWSSAYIKVHTFHVAWIT